MLRGGFRHDRAREVVAEYVAASTRFDYANQWPPRVERLERALLLALRLGGKNGAEVERVVHAMEAAMDEFEWNPNPWLPERLSTILFEQKLGDAEREAARCKRLVDAARKHGDARAVEEYSELLARWERRNGRGTEARDALLEVARSHEATAERVAESNPMQAESELLLAIRSARRAGSSRDYVNSLIKKRETVQQRVIDGMVSISTPIQAGESGKLAQREVAGRTLADALVRLAILPAPVSIDALTENLRASMKEFPLLYSFGASVKSERGSRTTAHYPTTLLGPDDEGSPSLRARLFAEAAWKHDQMVVEIIEPARRQILTDHGPCLSQGTIEELVEPSPLVPSSRAP